MMLGGTKTILQSMGPNYAKPYQEAEENRAQMESLESSIIPLKIDCMSPI